MLVNIMKHDVELDFKSACVHDELILAGDENEQGGALAILVDKDTLYNKII